MRRRHFLFGAAATALAATGKHALTQPVSPLTAHADGPLKIESVELIELHGTYIEQAGINAQPQVNPLDVYDGNDNVFWER